MEIKVLFSPLLKWWWLIIVAALLAASTSFIAIRQEPILYQSRTTLLIGSPFDSLNPDGSELWLSSQLAESYAGFAYREPVQEATMDALGLEWLPEYNIAIPPNTQFIEIYVIDTDPQRAQLVANELANQLIRLSPSGQGQEEKNRQEFVNNQLNDLQIQIEGTTLELENQQIKLGNYVSARDIADAQNQIDALQSKLSSLQLNYATLLSNSAQKATNTLAVIEPAFLPEYPIGRNLPLTIIMSALMGAVLASGAAIALEYFNDTVESPEELELFNNISVLSSIPSSKLAANEQLITRSHPRSPTSEIFRDLRTKVQFSDLDKDNRTILITSANPGEGKSFVAANLSIVLAQAGFKTLLIDADLRLPDQHRLFEINNKYGLTDVLRNPQNYISEIEIFSDFNENTVKIPGIALDVLTRGSQVNNPSELLGAKFTKDFLNHVSKQYEFVIIDSAPSLSLTDSLILGRYVNGVILVVNAKGTSRKQIRQLISRFHDVNANLIGFVLNMMAQKNLKNLYYSYSYGNEPDDDVKIENKKNNRWGREEKQPLTEDLAKE